MTSWLRAMLSWLRAMLSWLRIQEGEAGIGQLRQPLHGNSGAFHFFEKIVWICQRMGEASRDRLKRQAILSEMRALI